VRRGLGGNATIVVIDDDGDGDRDDDRTIKKVKDIRSSFLKTQKSHSVRSVGRKKDK